MEPVYDLILILSFQYSEVSFLTHCKKLDKGLLHLAKKEKFEFITLLLE